MTIHLVGLPHTRLDARRYSTCAFTTKAIRWTRVLERIGTDVVMYWGGGLDPLKKSVDCEVVEVLTNQEWVDRYDGESVAKSLPKISWDGNHKDWYDFNTRCIREVQARIKPGDIVAIWAGNTQQIVVDAFKGAHVVIEPAVGYEGIAKDTFCCFESYAWMHNRYGAEFIGNGRSYDAVIPNFLDPDDFELGEDEGYALFLGRMTQRKGPHVAIQAARLAGKALWMAGAGASKQGDRITMDTDFWSPAPDRYMGPVDSDGRRDLLKNASVLIVPTLYIEPFGTVHIEALMSGVPVVTSDWGVFTETVRQGKDGYRFRVLQEAADGILNASEGLRSPLLRADAIDRFSLDAVAPKFERWLWLLEELGRGNGWDTTREQQTEH